MSNALPPGYAVPNTSLPKTTGTLNIIFASLVLIYVVLQIAMMFAGPAVLDFAQERVQQAQASEEAARKREIEQLRKLEEEAGTEEAKMSLRSQREALEAEKAPTPPDMMALGQSMEHPTLKAYAWINLGTSLILNIAMLVSGIGLLRLRERARRLAIWVAGLKIARHVLLGLLNVAVVMPVSLKIQQEVMRQMAASGAGNADAMAKIGAAAGVASIVFAALLSMIWPVVMLILLTRPGARAACQGTSEGPMSETDPDLARL